MSTPSPQHPQPNATGSAPGSALSLKGGMTAHVLLPVQAHTDLAGACDALTALLQDSPGEFDYTPCVLAFPGRGQLPDWLPEWVDTLRQQRLVPFAVQCTGAADQARVQALGLSDMPVPEPGARRPRPVAEAEKAPEPEPEPEVRKSMVVRTQVRSGQQIYARDSDLVIIASVSAGAEIMADYDIHVYGELRGRALAGVRGNNGAQIFCQTLDAELVAINGVYMLPEQFPDTRTRVQIQLDNDQLEITGS